jgi:hypothetical protein
VKLLIAIVLLGCAANAQSLGEVARQNRPKRGKAAPAGRAPITDETLVRQGGQSVDVTLQRLYREFKQTVPQPAKDHAHVFWLQVLRPENRAVPQQWDRLHTQATGEMSRGCARDPQFKLPDANQKAMEDFYNTHIDLLRGLQKRYQRLLTSQASAAEMQKIEYDVIAADIQIWQMFYEWTWLKVDCATLAERGKKNIID